MTSKLWTDLKSHCRKFYVSSKQREIESVIVKKISSSLTVVYEVTEEPGASIISWNIYLEFFNNLRDAFDSSDS